MSWQIVVVKEVRDWLHDMRRTDRATLLLISAAIDILAARGPALGRPLVDTIRGSKLAHLKELRPGSTRDSEIRILFAFDPERRAVLLVGGDKCGNWMNWYREEIPIAEYRYEEHLNSVEIRGTEDREGETR